MFLLLWFSTLCFVVLAFSCWNNILFFFVLCVFDDREGVNLVLRVFVSLVLLFLKVFFTNSNLLFSSGLWDFAVLVLPF